MSVWLRTCALCVLLATGAVAEGEPSATEAPITLSANDLELAEILSMFARSRGLNIVAGESILGRISIELHDVPFEEGLRAVVAMAGYEITRKGDIYFVHRPSGPDPAGSIMNETRTFRLDYAKSPDLLPVIQALLSPLGRALSYPPLRALVVEDRPTVLERVATVVASLDTPPRQVVIEAQILEARLSHDMRFGIDWSLVFSHGDGAGNVTVEGFAGPSTSGEGFFLTWGEGDFTAALEALESVNELNTLAKPRILAVDGSDAEIIIGGQLGFPVVTTVENTVLQSVEFLDVGTQLTVTPTIAADGYVLMRIHPELSDGVVQNGLPSKTTTQVSSEVLIRDGHTLLIGGLIRERTETDRRGIPILNRIPIIGGLFGKTVQTVDRSELITLITPRIVRPGEHVAYEGNGLLKDTATD